VQAVVLYYKLEPVELLPGLIGYKVAKEKEELVNVKDEEEATYAEQVRALFEELKIPIKGINIKLPKG